MVAWQSNRLVHIAERINAEHQSYIGAMRRGIEHAINAGELLQEAKDKMGHGHWAGWLRKECPTIQPRTARLYMQIAKGKAKVRAKMATVADLTLQQAATLVSGCERRGANADDEWYTPPEIIELVRTVLGEIDLDPASCIEAQRTVMAKRFYTKHNDGLCQKWLGRVFLNPPYSNLVPWIRQVPSVVQIR